MFGRTVIAIDPGAISGAFALFGSNRTALLVGDLPVVDGQLDAATLARSIRDNTVEAAVVERVGAMPKQGIASTWKFAFACGVINGVLKACGVEMTYVAPPTWKRHFNLIGKDKEASRARALELYPRLEGLQRKKDQGRAEALLIGQWFLTKEK